MRIAYTTKHLEAETAGTELNLEGTGFFIPQSTSTLNLNKSLATKIPVLDQQLSGVGSSERGKRLKEEKALAKEENVSNHPPPLSPHPPPFSPSESPHPPPFSPLPGRYLY